MSFKQMPDEILYGAAYYPEVWPEKEMDRDIEYMKELRMNVMRIGEFSWVLLEPEEGEFEFEWLQRIIEKLNRNGIYTILGTPTAAPPAWLTSKYPQVMPVDENGVRKTHGGRRHYTYNSEIYRKLSGRIVEKMAKEFGQKEGVIAWQT
ncbi:MAG: beta-galactosidase, partial [Bacillota bacterium]